jgi:hypothetical protein
MDPAMLVRATLMLLVSVAAILSYELLYEKRYRNRPLPLALGLAVAAFVLVFRVATFGIGAIAASGFAAELQSSWSGKAVLALGGLACLWLGSVGLQLLQNVVLTRTGRPRRKVRWIR